MGRPRSPERGKVMEIYLESDGKKTTKELAEAAGVSESRIRKWKSLDKWEETLKKRPKKRGAQPGNRNAAGRTPAKDNNRNAVTHGAYVKVQRNDIQKEDLAAIMEMKPGETALRMNEELQELLVRKVYLTGLLREYTDPKNQGDFYADRIVHMVAPVSLEEKARALGTRSSGIKDPEREEELKTTLKTIIKSSPFERMMRVEGELNKLNGRIIKLLDSMRALETEQMRIDIELRKLKLARQRAIGEFEIEDIEDEENDAQIEGNEG